MGQKKPIDMGMNEYQRKAAITWHPGPRWLPIIYPILGLCGEAGEAAEKVKKWIRDGEYPDPIGPERKELLKKELGDVLWYLAAVARDLNLTFDEIARDNIAKITDRKNRKVVHGEGDTR